MIQKPLGATNDKISALGLGCMGMSHAYGAPDDPESLATLDRALELGINFWDTADYYGDGENERLISKALRGRREKIFLATKFGLRATAQPGTHFSTDVDGSPRHMREAIERSLRRLGTDYIDLYYLHRVDRRVPIEDTVAAMAGLVREGKVRHLGLSEANAAMLRRAHKVHYIAALQSEYSLLTRDIEKEILPAVNELRMTLVPFSPLGRGMFTENFDISKIQPGDSRHGLPRFQGKHLLNNQNLMRELGALAAAKNMTTAQLALAWVLGKGDNIVPIPGTKRIKYLEANARAADIRLTPDDIRQIETIIARHPDTGERYQPASLELIQNQ